MTTDASAKAPGGFGEFRKRIPLELSPEHLAQLRALQPQHGSMRATLLAGLEALSRLAEVQAQLVELAEARDAAQARVAELETKAEATKAAAAKEDAKANRASRAVQDESDQAVDRLRTLEAHISQLQRDLTDAQATQDDTYQTLLEFDETRVDELRCPRCENSAPSDEWGYRDAKDGGQLIFHEPCGFHKGGLLESTTIMGRRHDG